MKRLLLPLAFALLLPACAQDDPFHPFDVQEQAAAVTPVTGAAFTTTNSHVDGVQGVCLNRAVNCNVYGTREYVWLNGGPIANGLQPDGDFFFAVLEAGGMANPNDGAASNLSDDYDSYTNRTFVVTNGEVSAYVGTHSLDSGKGAAGPNGLVPYIRLYPFASSMNPGGAYVLAVCSLADGYPVNPASCRYDSFIVKPGS